VPELTAVARSPIAPAAPEVVVAGWAVSGRRSAAALVISDCSAMTKVLLKAPAEGSAAQQVGVPFGRAARQAWPLGAGDVSVLVVGSGPGEWLVLAPPGTQDGVLDHLASGAVTPTDELVTVVDLTHGRALIRLTGARAVDVLAKETAVDLSEPVHPDGAALRTAVAGLATDVVRDDRTGVTSFLLHCERSSGQYLFDSLLDAGAEFGIEIDGYVPPESEET
jgi:heterotetrameric sarcosine oxidase gamma subunit